MRNRYSSLIPLVLAFVLTAGLSYAQEQPPSSKTPDLQAETVEEVTEDDGESIIFSIEVPLFSDLFSNTPAAVVEQEIITLGDLRKRMESISENETEEPEPGKQDYLDLLDRMVNGKLISFEARSMGLDELPEVSFLVDDFSKKIIRLLLIKRHLDSAEIRAEEGEVEELYRKRVREIEISSVLFEKKEDAEEAREEMEESGFYEVASKYVEENKAIGGEEAQFMEAESLAPQIIETEGEMEEGSISPVVKLGPRYAIFVIEGIRFPEDPEAMEEARENIIDRKRKETVRIYRSSLQKKYSKVKKRRVERLDLESEKVDIDELLEDDRVLVKIKGEDPIRVADLVRKLKNKLYHGAEKAAESKRLNMRKFPTLYDMIQKRVEIREALRLGIDKTAAYRERVNNYEEALLFEAFVKKVIMPEIRLNEDELREYYNEHIAEYTSEELVRLKGLVFHNVGDAQEVIDKLSRGTDFKWLSANAEGQVDKDAEGLYVFENRLVPLSELPQSLRGQGLRDTVAGAEEGELKLYESPEGYFYVISIQEVIPPEPEPYEKVESSIARIVQNEKITESMSEWTESLRGAYDFEIFVTELRNNP